MSLKKSNLSVDYPSPIAESTHIEGETSTPSRLKFTWGGKFSPRRKIIAVTSSSSSVNKVQSRPKKLDSKIFRDTQSKGLASRIVKYYEANEAKAKPVINQIYNRVGDFPIVHLDKKEIKLNPTQQNGSIASKGTIASPVRSSNPTNIRSMIFRTGKNYGDSQISASTTSNAITASRENVPLASHTNEYESSPTRSVLDELKEISRKRIHCDELDGDNVKKQKSSCALVSDSLTIPTSTSHIMKRGRDRTSPSDFSSIPETQHKRCKNNDILSSLSSSLLLNSPKHHVEAASFTYKPNEASSNKQQLFFAIKSHEGIKARPSIHSDDLHHLKQKKTKRDLEVHTLGNQLSETENKQLPSTELQLPPTITKTMSKIPKLTLFNKQYDKPRSETAYDSEQEHDLEENKISFIKPKSKAVSVFSGANKSARSKLSMMISCLAEGNKDEVDGSLLNKSNVCDVTRSSSANINTNTSVTFSTATTTSVLSLPSKPILTSTGTEIAKNTANENQTVLSVPNDSLASPEVVPDTAQPPLPKTTITLTATTSAVLSKELTAENRMGGFCSSETIATPTLSKQKSAALSSIPNALATVTSSSTPTFTFKLPAQKAPSIDKNVEQNEPAITFAMSKPASSSENNVNKTLTLDANSSPSVATNMAPVISNFSFGNQSSLILPVNTPVKPNGNIVSTSATNASISALNTTFTFGSNATTTKTATEPMTSTTTSLPPTPALFGFGSSSNLPTFQSSNVSTNTTTSIVPNSTTSFSFGPKTAPLTIGATTGSSVNTTKPASSNMFGMQTTTQTTTTTTQAFTFGNKANELSVTATTASQLDLSNIFRSTMAPTSTPSSNLFGNNNTITTTTSSIFGTDTSAFNNTSAPTFGSIGSQPTFNSGNLQQVSTKTGTPFNTSIFSSAESNQSTFGNPSLNKSTVPTFGSSSSNQPAPPANVFESGFKQNVASDNPASSSIFGRANNQQPAFGSSQTNVFGSSTGQNQTIGTSLFGSQGTQQPSNQFTFGNNQSTTNATTISSNVFGSSTTNPVFAFGGQSNNNNDNNNGTFGPKPDVTASFAFRPNSNNTKSITQTAPPAYGSGGFGFNTQPSDSKTDFSFKATNNTTTPAFGFSSLPPTANSSFGPNNNALNTTFNFGSSSNVSEATKSFNFAGNNANPSTNLFGSPASGSTSVEPFAFNAGVTPTLGTNAFQFNAGPQAAVTNIFSLPSGTVSNTNKGRHIRQATRRILTNK